MEEAPDRFTPWWAPLAFAEGRWYRWNMAGAEIAVCRSGNVWRGRCRSLRWDRRNKDAGTGVVCTDETATSENSTTAGNENSTTAESGSIYNVYTSVGAGTSAALRPCLPEKPFLVKTAALSILPGMEVTVELDLPPLFRLIPVEHSAAGIPADGEAGIAGGGPAPANPVNGEALFTFSPFVLNETWYGADTTRGILCASLPANAPGREQASDPAADTPGMVRSTALIRNRGKAALELSAFPLYAGELAVYGKDRRLFCDNPVIDAYGNGDFRMTARTGREETPPGLLLCPGSKSAGPTLVHQGTRIIRNLTGL